MHVPTGGPVLIFRVREGLLEDLVLKLRPISAAESPVFIYEDKCSGSQSFRARETSAVIRMWSQKFLNHQSFFKGKLSWTLNM